MDASERYVLPVFECSIIGCKEKTGHPENRDPRKRWIISLELSQEDSSPVLINLCPYHTREHFHLDEDFYSRVERSEKLISAHYSN